MPEIDTEQKIIFVVGNSRSGTTMMSSILFKNPRVMTFPELHFFEQRWRTSSTATIGRRAQLALAEQLLALIPENFFEYAGIKKDPDLAERIVSGLPEETLPPAVFGAFLKVISRLWDREIACDQTPRNVLFMREIEALFPGALFINMVRDPRDVLLSQKNKWQMLYIRSKEHKRQRLFERVRLWVNYHPVTMGLLWNANINAGAQHQQDPRVLTVRFEDLLDHPDEEARHICEFAGLEYSPAMLNIPLIGSSYGNDDPSSRGVRKEAAGRWRKRIKSDAVDLYICQVLCRKNMQALGYPIDAIPVNPFALAGAWLVWPVKAFLALLFNLGRSANIFSSIQRRLKQALG